MDVLYRFAGDTVRSLGAREFQGVAATSSMMPDGYALTMSGGDLSRFGGGGGPLLADHDATKPVGLAWLSTAGTRLLMRGEFAPAGASPLADEKCRLLKAGVLKGVSLGFVVNAGEPVTPGRPSDGIRATRWTAMEVSVTALPMDSSAVVTARAAAPPAHGRSRAELDLIAVAAEFGDELSEARIAHLVAEARWCGQTPAYRYRQIQAAAGRSLSPLEDYAQRLAAVERFRDRF